MNSARAGFLLLIACFSGAAFAMAAADPAPTKPSPAEVINFAMLDQRGQLFELRRATAKVVVLVFTANECPVSRQCVPRLRSLREKFSAQDVQIFMVNASPSNDRKSISKEMSSLGAWHIPVLKDDTQGVARYLGVKCTGETFAINTRDWGVFYHGAIDDQLIEGAKKGETSDRYLEQAVNEFLEGKPISKPSTVAHGCVIKFQGDDAPDFTPVSYVNEVASILERKCVHCHSPGNIGSWSMSNYKKVKGMSSMIEEVLLARRMPPWDADPAIGRFANNCSLSIPEAQTLQRWVHQGAPRGNGNDPLETNPPKPPADWPLGQPDLILRLPNVEQIPATGVLDYRHIEVVAGNTNELWVGGVWVKPGNNKVVHHVIARVKDGRKDHLGQREMFAGWAPGATRGFFPEGSGKLIPADAKFDFEMHYTPNGAPQTDQTEIGLYLLKEKPSKRFESVPVVNTTFEIQPGDPNSTAQGMYGFTRGATLHSVTPHMHLRGRSMKFEALFPDGKRETICSVPRYDFNWQLTYVLEKPKKIVPGTWALLSGSWDNSTRNPANPDPKKTIHWGDQSFDEMFLGWYNVTWDLDPPNQVAAKANTRSN